jgi:hypothetical protein
MMSIETHAESITKTIWLQVKKLNVFNIKILFLVNIKYQIYFSYQNITSRWEIITPLKKTFQGFKLKEKSSDLEISLFLFAL